MAATSPADENAETVLVGGLANVGKVVRVGDTVRRPLHPTSGSVHDYLAHLESEGFDGAPRFLGIDDAGRAILTYIHGDVDRDTDPIWARASDELLVSVAELQRRLHDASRSYEPPTTFAWDPTMTPPRKWAPAFVSHNDMCVSNVVVRDGRATAFIDFDFAAPTHPLWDVAIAARHWVPVRDPADDAPSRMLELNLVDRFQRYCDAYGVAVADRGTVVEMLGVFLDQALENMRTRYLEGRLGYVEVWERGYAEHNRRSRAWIDTNRSALCR